MDGGNNGARNPREASYQPLVTVLVSLVVGILLDRRGMVPIAFWMGTSGVAGVAWSLLWRSGASRAAACLLLVSLGALGGAWHHYRWRLFRNSDVGLCTAENATPVCLDGVALSSPRSRPGSGRWWLNSGPDRAETAFQLRVLAVRDGKTWRPASGRCDCFVGGPLAGVRAGDRLRVFGYLTASRPPANPGEFDFAARRRGERRLRRIRVDGPHAVQLLQRPVAWHPGWVLPRLRQFAHRRLVRYVPPEQVDLAAAILLGTRGGIAGERSDNFLVSGTAHLLAISGLHVGILSWGIWLLGRTGICSRRRTLLLIVSFVLLYALLTDAQPPVVRAGVLISIVCAAKYSGRQASALNSLAAAGLLVLWINPCSLFWLGTQFSFLAVAALSCQVHRGGDTDSVHPLDRLIAESRPWPQRVLSRGVTGLLRIVKATAWIWFVTAPLVLHRFHLVTPIALLVNPLLWMPVGIALFSGFGVLLLGGCLPPAARVLGACCSGSLQVVEWVIERAVLVPASHFWTPAPPTTWMMLFYCGLACWIFCPRLRQWPQVALGLAGGWILVAVLLVIGRWDRPGEEDGLSATFISVGHGTSVLLEFPGGDSWLYDAGRLGNPRHAVRSISSVLWHRGIRRLNGVILSHADADHYNALPGLLERFPVRTVYVAPCMFAREDSQALRALQSAIDRHGVMVRQLSGGIRLSPVAGVVIEVLHPPAAGVAGSDNANSIVASIAYGGRSLLLPGDLESPGLDRLLEMPARDCDILMAPHHGSLRSDPQAMTEWSRPEWVVICSGAGPSAVRSKQAYADRALRVLHTAEEGAVRVCLSRGRTTVQSWCRSPWP